MCPLSCRCSAEAAVHSVQCRICCAYGAVQNLLCTPHQRDPGGGGGRFCAVPCCERDDHAVKWPRGMSKGLGLASKQGGTKSALNTQPPLTDTPTILMGHDLTINTATITTDISRYGHV